MPTKTTAKTAAAKAGVFRGSDKERPEFATGTIKVINRKDDSQGIHFLKGQQIEVETPPKENPAVGPGKRVQRMNSVGKIIQATAEAMQAGIPQKALPRRPPRPPALVGGAMDEEKTLARKLVAEVSKDNADVKALCDTYQLKREELGRLTGFSLRALAGWANDKLPSQPARRRLREVRRLLDALAEIVTVESIPQWLHQTNPEFAPLTPLQVIELGEIDRLWAMVYNLGSGQLD